MSHPTIRFHCSSPPTSFVVRSAVMIPASGPCPSQRSPTPVMPSAAYFWGAAITFTCFVISPSSARIRKSIGAPSISTNALSRPKRVLPPPANTYPRTTFSLVLSPCTPRLCVNSLLSERCGFVNYATILFLPHQSARVRGVEFPTRAAFPASFAGADQWSPPFAKHSSDGPQAAWSSTLPRTCASPRENPFRPAHCNAHLPNVFAPALHRARLRPVNPRRRFLRRGTAPGCAPAHSSARAHFPANRSARLRRRPPASAAPCVRAAPRASAKKIPPAREGPACVRAEAAILWSQRADDKTDLPEIFRRELPPANRDASR